MIRIKTNDDLLKQAISSHFPHIAVYLRGNDTDLDLVDRVVRINPDVKIFAADDRLIEAIQAKYYVTPLHAEGSIEDVARDWNLRAVIVASPRGPRVVRVSALVA